MLRACLRRLSSAHALAFLALMVALGGTLATAGNGPAPKRTAAYHVFDSQSSHSAGGRTVVARLPLPTKGLYAVSAKFDVRKETSGEYATGTVSCSLIGGSRQFDTSVVTVAPGETENLSLSSVDRYRAATLTCSSAAGPFLVSNVR